MGSNCKHSLVVRCFLIKNLKSSLNKNMPSSQYLLRIKKLFLSPIQILSGSLQRNGHLNNDTILKERVFWKHY